MTNETEGKILDAALKLFAEKGYVGATTRIIAKEAGVSELTLFRKFKTKENLFDILMNQNLEKMKEDFESILIYNEFEGPRNSVSGPRNEVSYGPRDFLETFIINYIGVVEKNFEVLFLIVNGNERKFDPAIADYFKRSTEYLEKNIPDSKINQEAFALTLAGFTYMICIGKYKGSTIIDYGDVIEKFINNAVLCVQ